MSHRSVLSFAIALIATTAVPSTAAAPGVEVRLFQFRPARVDVAANTEVVWTNTDDIAHTVTAGTPDRPDPRFDLDLGGKGATARAIFREPGVFPYFCSRHQHMRGEVHVR
jgi:plastocyanin